MIKQVTVTFEFDGEKETISNLKCFIDGVEKKKTTTRTKAKKEEKEKVLEDEAVITLEANKICFNNKAVANMELEYQDRVLIKYEKIKGSKKPVPIIGKDLAFDEEGSGNKVTKSNTISYRGDANNVLSQYGKKFTLEDYDEGKWKLIAIGEESNEINESSSYKDVVKNAEDIDLTVITDEDEDLEIDEMTFKL